jgi:hypothetical protein
MFATRLRTAFLVACTLATAALCGCGNATPPPPPTAGGGAADPTATPPVTGGAPSGVVQLPSYWYETDIAAAWTGKRWDAIDLFTYIEDRPEGLDTGTHYVVFFGRTCDHCEEMFNNDLATNPALAGQVTAIEVPVDKDRLRGDDAWPLPETECTFGQLRLGPDWIMTTPVTVRLQDGVVQCAQEGGHAECMGL